MKRRFSPRHHLFKFSHFFLKSFATPSIIYLIIIGNLFLLSGASLFFAFEKGINQGVLSFFDALWWAFTTVTTVGYGDIVPITYPGRIIGIALMLSGAVFFFGFTAILISVFSSLTTEEFLETEKLTKREYEDVVKKLNDLSNRVENINIKIDSIHARLEINNYNRH